MYNLFYLFPFWPIHVNIFFLLLTSYLDAKPIPTDQEMVQRLAAVKGQDPAVGNRSNVSTGSSFYWVNNLNCGKKAPSIRAFKGYV